MFPKSARGFLWSREALPGPVLVLLIVVAVVPSAGVLWFMRQALEKEGDAGRARLLEAYDSQLAGAASTMRTVWNDRRQVLEPGAEAPVESFDRARRLAQADGAIVLDARGTILYPDAPRPPAEAAPLSQAWGDARRSEDEGDYARAAARYADAVRQPDSLDEQAMALRAQARCLARTNQREAALALLLGPLDAARLAPARDPAGRLVVPDGLLLAVDLAGDAARTPHRRARERLLAWLESYRPPVLTARQRLFLYEGLRARWSGCPELPALVAEQLSAQYAAERRARPLLERLGPSGLPGVLELASAQGRVIALYREPRVAAQMQALLPGPTGGVRVSLDPPGAPRPEGALTVATVGGAMGDYHLALTAEGADPFASAFVRTRTVYLWTAGLILATIVAGSLITARVLGRQVRLTRLRNDLIATVSHEMRTPVASMRVLLDNLIEGDVDGGQNLSEYLELIRRENMRLGALVESFLTFSRLERRRFRLERAAVRLDEVVRAALDPLRERLEAPGCTVTVDVPADLPAVQGDRDALTTAVGNLVENALKYSGDAKEIAVRARPAPGAVCLEVEDNGVGFSRREARRLFEPFYQADQRLSRIAGGCGLGLSIVKSIVEAHSGEIAARGEPGKGATFSITLPS